MNECYIILSYLIEWNGKYVKEVVDVTKGCDEVSVEGFHCGVFQII